MCISLTQEVFCFDTLDEGQELGRHLNWSSSPHHSLSSTQPIAIGQLRNRGKKLLHASVRQAVNIHASLTPNPISANHRSYDHKFPR